MEEPPAHNRSVPGSSPGGPTIFWKGGYLQEKINLLEKAQRIDLEIDSIEEEKLYYPLEIEKVGREVQAGEKELEAIDSELSEMEITKKATTDDIAVCVERVRRGEERLNIVKNEKELNAITKEINAAKKEKVNKENELVKLRGRIDEKSGVKTEKEEGVLQRQANIKGLEKEFEEKKYKWAETLSRLQDERSVIVNELPPAVVKRYDSIREKRQGIAVVKVKHGACQGCYMSIPPQLYIQIMKGSSELIFCPHCHRILYFEHTDKEEQRQKEPA